MNDESFLQKLFARGNSYWLTRFVILRLLGFVYAVAFLVAAQQLVPLVGEHGLTPANHFLESIQAHLGSRTAGMLRVPTLFWFGISDQGLSIFAWIGFGLSLVVLGGYANAILLGVLWAMYMSIVHVGQIWYGYGWETQLLETGFLVDLSLSVARWPAISQMPAADSRDLAFSLARFSHHDRRRPDQTARRSMLARSHLPLLSLRNAADPEPDQPLSAFRAALVPQIRNGLEPFHRTDRALVFLRSAACATCCRRLARQFSNLSHHQRQSFVSELRDDHSVSRLF